MKKILLADDDANFLLLLKDILEVHGYQVTATKDGEEVLDKIKQETPDLFILDIMMPGIDGASVLYELKQNKSAQNKPIIFISGMVKKDNYKIPDTLAENVNYLPKPFEVNELLKLVDKLLKH